jgi:streptomycin 6-kinase
VQHLLNCDESLLADPIRLLSEVADLAGLGPGRVRQWLFARCVQESLGEAPWLPFGVVLQRLGGP